MPGIELQTDAFVLHQGPPTDAFRALQVFSGEHGLLRVHQRLPKPGSAAPKRGSRGTPVNHQLDLFDEAALRLESSNLGRTWFVREARLVARPEGIGRDYERLRFASALASLVVRHPGPVESREPIVALLRRALPAFAAGVRPDVVYFKSLYRFGRDEGYPLEEDWLPRLPAAERELVRGILQRPVAEQEATPETVARLQRRLEVYLRDHTEILPE